MEDRRLLATITVTGTGDTIADDGVVTLREAITAANTNAASGDAPAGTTGLDTIDFDIPGPGVHTISLTSSLPTITDAIFIDGFTQPDSHPNTNAIDQGVNALPLIELNGSGAGGANGLSISAGNSMVRGLVIDQFNIYGIWLTGTGGDHIEGDFIGTDSTGMIAQGNVQGIRSEVDDVTIGGPAPAQRNVISGNFGNAEVESRGDRAVIQGNYVGIGADGSTVLGGANRVVVSGSSNTVGGSTAGSGNVIANYNAYSLAFENGGGTGKTYHDGLVQGNRIGVNAAGTALTNNADFYDSEGIIVDGWTNLTIGGTSPGAANIIGGASPGIDLALSTGVLIQGNAVGTDLTGTLNFGGNAGYGIEIGGDLHYGGSDNNTIGGTVAGAGNIIANHGNGVFVDFESTNNTILSNTIFVGNFGDAILLADPNHLVESNVVGGNHSQAAPVLTSASRSGGSTTVMGTIDSTPNAAFTVQLYSNDTCCYDGLGPGQALLGTITTLPTDANGHLTFRIDVPSDIPDGKFLSATATDPSGNTSEFSLDLIMGHRLIVTNTDDSGTGSLRQAILCANVVPGTDTIAFNIPGSGVQTIDLASALPTITDPVIIDGYSQPGASPNTQTTGDNAVRLIELDGVAYGLLITAGNSVVRGLTINRSVYSGVGISLSGKGGNLIEGDFIGTDASGSTAQLNFGDDGVLIFQSPNNTIGGTTPAARNIISGNGGDGIDISGTSANTSSNLVQGNLIGTTASGGALGNGVDGIEINGSGNTVGGSAAGAGNIIAYNQFTGIGVSSSQETSILSNTITNNQRDGVLVGSGGQGTSILSNSLFDNSYLGISLGNGISPTPNDPGDTDTGPNGLQNDPVITSATTVADITTIVGTLNSTPNSTFHIEFFGNGTADSSARGVGQTLLGSIDVPTDPSGNGSFTVPFAGTPNFVAATATDPSGNTSEFSNVIATTTEQAASADLSISVTVAPDPLTLGGNLTYTLTVTNQGPDSAPDVIATDTLPSGVTFVSATGGVKPANGQLTFELGTLANGDQATLKIEVTPTSAGTLTDTADVTTQSGVRDPDSDDNTDTESSTVNPATSAADLSVAVTAAPDPLTLGSGNLTYTLTVTNQGPDSAPDVIATDTLPSGVTFVSATGVLAPNSRTLTFDLGTLADGAQTTLTIVVTPTAAGTLTNSASISGSVADPDMSNNSASRDTTVQVSPPTNTPDLAVSFARAPGFVITGQEVTYTITVTDSVAAATHVELTDALPPGVDFVRATGGVAPVDGVLTFNLGDLAEDADVVMTVVVIPRTTGLITNMARAGAAEDDSNPANSAATQTIAVDAPISPPTSPPSPSPDPGGPSAVSDGPTVMRVRRFGFHAQPTWFVINFSGALDPTRATKLRQLCDHGSDCGSEIRSAYSHRIGHLRPKHTCRDGAHQGPTESPPPLSARRCRERAARPDRSVRHTDRRQS